MRQPLSGVKILDLSRVLAGPYATMILGDMGAEVIKVERPVIGDDSRGFGPFVNGESAYYISINRNKKSITLNLKEEAGKKILLDLVKDVDVLVENYRPGTMEKLGLGYDILKEVNPNLIYAAISGFGHSGPYSKKPAYDGVVQAMGGMMSITGQVGGEPTRVGPSIGDLAAGMFGSIGILSAIIEKLNTGIGQKVDVAMLDCQVALLENAIARYTVSGKSPEPIGNKHSSIVPFEPFTTSDGQIMIAAGNDALWKKLVAAMGREELGEDERFLTNNLRYTNYKEVKPLIDEEIITESTSYWQDRLDEFGVPNGPINNVEMLINDPQIKEREMIVDITHPIAGELKVPGIPIKLSETPGMIKTIAPALGEHTDEILKGMLGLSDEKINELKDKDVI